MEYIKQFDQFINEDWEKYMEESEKRITNRLSDMMKFIKDIKNSRI